MPTVWLNGRFIEGEASIDAADRGFLLGDGVFDTALVLGGTVFRGRQHVDRLVQALGVLEIPVARGDLEAAMAAMAERQGSGSIRLTVTRGPGPRGLRYPAEPAPTVLGTSAPLGPASMFAPVRCAVADIRRNETSPLSRLKSLGYLDNILASRRAERAGASEALFLNTKGLAACSSLANIFAVEGFELVTPPLKDGALPGITRAWILENAEDYGLRPLEASIPAKRLDRADALFLTNSLRLVSPATLPGQAESAAVSDVVRRLMEGLCEAISKECGIDPRDGGVRLPEG